MAGGPWTVEGGVLGMRKRVVRGSDSREKAVDSQGWEEEESVKKGLKSETEGWTGDKLDCRTIYSCLNIEGGGAARTGVGKER